MTFVMGNRMPSWYAPFTAFGETMANKERDRQIKKAQDDAEQAQRLQAGLSIGGMALGAGIGGLAAGSIAGAGLGASLGSTAGSGIAQMISPTPGGAQQVARSAQGSAGDLMNYGMAQERNADYKERRTSAQDWDAFTKFGMTMTDAKKWSQLSGTTPEMELMRNQAIMARQTSMGAKELVSDIIYGTKSSGLDVTPSMRRDQQMEVQAILRGIEQSNKDMAAGDIEWYEHVDEMEQYRKKAMGIMGSFSINPKQLSPQERWQKSTFVGEDGITRGFDRNDAPKVIHEPESPAKMQAEATKVQAETAQTEVKARQAATKDVKERRDNYTKVVEELRKEFKATDPTGYGEMSRPDDATIDAMAERMLGTDYRSYMPERPVPPRQPETPPFLAQQPDPAQMQRMKVQQYQKQMQGAESVLQQLGDDPDKWGENKEVGIKAAWFLVTNNREVPKDVAAELLREMAESNPEPTQDNKYLATRLAYMAKG